jgi:Tfp pilus assembly protein PilE
MNGFMYIVIFIAVALVSIIIYEAYVSYTQKVRVYTLADSLVNLYCGILERSVRFVLRRYFLNGFPVYL